MSAGEPRIGLVGVGDWGRHILRDLRDLGTRVEAVARSDASIARASKGGAASIVGSASDLSIDCDGYVVASPTTSHLDAVEALLPRGKPIFVEKPLSQDIGRIRHLPAEASRLVFTMHKWRYHPGICELARIASEEEFGPLLGLRTFRMGWENHHKDVNSIWTLLPHDMSIALHVLGEVPSILSAMPDPTISGPHGVIVRASTSSGTPVVIEVSAGKPNKHRSVVLACRDAACELDDANYGRIVIRPRGTLQSGDFEERLVADDMPLHAELKAFLRHLAGGPPPYSSLADETAIVAAIQESIDLAFG